MELRHFKLVYTLMLYVCDRVGTTINSLVLILFIVLKIRLADTAHCNRRRRIRPINWCTLALTCVDT